MHPNVSHGPPLLRRLPQGSHACRILYVAAARTLAASRDRAAGCTLLCLPFLNISKCNRGERRRRASAKAGLCCDTATAAALPAFISGLWTDFNQADGIYSTEVRTQPRFFLSIFLSFFVEAGSISCHHLKRSPSDDSSQSIWLRFHPNSSHVVLESIMSAKISVKEAFKGKQHRPVASAEGGEGGGGFNLSK